MKLDCAVTFEFDLRPPLTFRSRVEATNVATCVSRATRNAQKALAPKGWSSLVCCVLARDTEAKEAA